METATENPGPDMDFARARQKMEELCALFTPKYTSLSLSQRKTRNPLGPKRRGFVDLVYGVFSRNDEFMPKTHSVEDLERQMAALREVELMRNALKKLDRYVKNADCAVSYETLNTILGLYRYLREAARSGLAGAAALYGQLRLSFPQNRKGKPEGRVSETLPNSADDAA